MSCEDLTRLRKHATELRQQIMRANAQAKAKSPTVHLHGGRARSDIAVFLERRLHRVTLRIKDHVASHQCEA